MTHQPRDTPQFYLTAPSPCPYLPGRMERKVFTHIVGERAADLNDIECGDLDGDGAVDLIAASSSGALFFRNLGQRRFAPPVALGTIACTDVELVDVDGDGDLDVVVLGSSIAIYHNNGSGVLLMPVFGSGFSGCPCGQQFDPQAE